MNKNVNEIKKTDLRVSGEEQYKWGKQVKQSTWQACGTAGSPVWPEESEKGEEREMEPKGYVGASATTALSRSP